LIASSITRILPGEYHTMRVHRLAFVVLLLAPLAVSAQPATVDTVTVVDYSGREQTGFLQQLTETELTIAGESPKRFDLSGLMSMRFGERVVVARQRGPLVLLAGGDRLFLQPATLDEDDLVGIWRDFPAWSRLKIPLEQIQAIAFQLPDDAPTRHRLVAALLEFGEKRDVVIFRNGDRLGGRLVRLTADALVFEGPVGELAIPRNNIRALAFNSGLINAPKKTGQRVLLELSDGSRLTVRRVILAEPRLLEVETLFRAKLRVPTSAVLSMRFLGGRAVYLSDLQVAEFQFTPYLATRWPLRLDRNVSGGPLRLNGREYAKGLGMHSRSVVSYDLAGEFQQFRATVGIDDSAGGKGSVRFAVEVDGERVFTSSLMTGATKPATIGPFDVSGKKRLTLIVEFGELGDILDHANWCDPVLIRAKAR
jgi:hypothetical protein